MSKNRKGTGKVEKDLDGFRKIVSESKSIREVIEKFGYKQSGGMYKQLRLKFDEHGIDTSHFIGQSWSKGLKRNTCSSIDKTARALEKPWNEVFCKNCIHNLSNKQIIRRLVREKQRPYKCEKCGLGDIWCEEKIVLQLDHKNGDNRDNREENLRLLCPNCHSQTPTFSLGKRLKKQ